jgi:hypothetical protein
MIANLRSTIILWLGEGRTTCRRRRGFLLLEEAHPADMLLVLLKEGNLNSQFLSLLTGAIILLEWTFPRAGPLKLQSSTGDVCLVRLLTS